MLKISSWNINSVRLRAKLVEEYLTEARPDILCLQETKTEDKFFPHSNFESLGYQHQAITGQKSYNGVAILSKIPLSNIDVTMITEEDGARHVSATIMDTIRLRNFYIPAGGDDADEEVNPKFKHKMSFLRTLRDEYTQNPAKNQIIMGDFNIAPHEHDVWSHKQLLKVVSHTPHEVALLTEFKEKADFYDILRARTDDSEKLYSWWSYRARDWEKSNRGRRLDHIWCSNDLKDTVQNFEIASHYRGKEKPSDHVPISVTFDI